ncbi:MAG TPA: hypothetical protein PLM78_05785, partial [Fervidobacterium sp.]|nr:hypothetical protein [Fervidobacterium sp.]
MQPRDEHAKRMEQDEKSDDKFQHMNKTALVEAIIFASRGADRETIAKLTNFDQEEIATIVEELKNSY